MSNHKKISLLKSVIRLGACGFGAIAAPEPEVRMVLALLFVAEIIGVIEEEFE